MQYKFFFLVLFVQKCGVDCDAFYSLRVLRVQAAEALRKGSVCGRLRNLGVRHWLHLVTGYYAQLCNV